MYATSFTTTANFERSASSVACYNHQKVTSLRISKLSPVTACTKRPFTHRYLRLGTWLCVCVGVCWITQVLQHFLPNGQIKKYVKQTFARHFKAKTRAHILNGKHLGAHTSTQTHEHTHMHLHVTDLRRKCKGASNIIIRTNNNNCCSGEHKQKQVKFLSLSRLPSLCLVVVSLKGCAAYTNSSNNSGS